MQGFKKILAIMIGFFVLNAEAINLTDLWYNPAESGWGANIVQQNDIMVVTLFVYSPTGEPTWYVASDVRATGEDKNGLPNLFGGKLYRAHGPWFGGKTAWKMGELEAVGELSIVPLSLSTLQFYYTINDLVIAKTVVRQTWRNHQITRFYSTPFNFTGLPQTIIGQRTDFVFYIVDGYDAVLMVFHSDGTKLCHYSGPYQQSGRFGAFSGQYKCNDGQTGKFEVTELELTSHGVTGYFRGWYANAIVQGSFSGAN